ARGGGHALGRPGRDGGGERVTRGVLGEIQVAKRPGEDGDHARPVLPVDLAEACHTRQVTASPSSPGRTPPRRGVYVVPRVTTRGTPPPCGPRCGQGPAARREPGPPM